MAYFSNGCEGDAYEAEFCSRCVHGKDEPGCGVMLLHLIWNYEQHRDKTKKVALETLIPREGIENKQCRMFVEVARGVG